MYLGFLRILIGGFYSAFLLGAPVVFAATPSFDSHGFKDVRVYPNATAKTPTKGVILLLKPQWLGREADEVARRLSREARLVIVVDLKSFHTPETKDRRQCASLSDCFVALSAYAQRKQKLTEIMMPSVLAIGETGKVAEEAWRQAPLSSFNAFISVDYCPGSLAKPDLSNESRTLWTVVASPKALANCPIMKPALLPLADIELARIPVSPRIRSGPMVRWVTAHLNKIELQALRHPASVQKINLDDLSPVVLDPKTSASYDAFIVLYSGDGGWAEFTDDLANGFTKLSMPVVGINSMRYFWKEKSPQQGADDLARLIRHFSARWGAKTVHLVGFSFGAGTLPFFTRRLPEDMRKSVGKVALLAPYRKADFEFFLSDWFFDRDGGSEVLPEVKALGTTLKPLCVFPTEEKKHSLCTQETDAPMTTVELPGGHHFGNEVAQLVRVLFPEARSR